MIQSVFWIGPRFQASCECGSGCGCNTQGVEPVSPQPSQPLTFTHPNYQKITPQQAKALMQKGVILIDVRDSAEFNQSHVKGAINIPLSSLYEGFTIPQAPDHRQEVMVMCRSGVRSEFAAQVLINSGYRHVYNAYGTLQWPTEDLT